MWRAGAKKAAISLKRVKIEEKLLWTDGRQIDGQHGTGGRRGRDSTQSERRRECKSPRNSTLTIRIYNVYSAIKKLTDNQLNLPHRTTTTTTVLPHRTIT